MRFLAPIGILLASAPASILVTLLLFPFWSWLEASTGIEAVGHSGPAGWCYAAVFGVVASGALLLLMLKRRARGQAGPDRLG